MTSPATSTALRSSAPRLVAVAARFGVAALVVLALTSNLLTAMEEGTVARNISMFTNQSNLFLVAMFLSTQVPRERRPLWFDDVRGAVTFYLVMTGIIYALLVAPLSELGRWDIGWTGIVLHRLAPVAALADWLLTPRQRRPSWKRLGPWLLYPVVFLVITWVRGAITGWYPYAFLDPTASSWGQVLATTGVVLVVFLVFALLVHLAEGRLRRREG